MLSQNEIDYLAKKFGVGISTARAISKANEDLRATYDRNLARLTTKEDTMLKMHKTKEGATMYIAQMTDEHLTNTIKFKLAKIEAIKAALDTSIQLSKFKKVMYKIDDASISERADQTLVATINSMAPYLAEAMLRGMSFSTELQALFERKGAEVTPQIALGDSAQGFVQIEDSEEPAY